MNGKNEAEKSNCKKMIRLVKEGYLAAGEIEFLYLIITCHNLKAADDPDADELIGSVLELMLDTDADQPLHYSLWLAFAPLMYEDPLLFFTEYKVQALREDYDPDCAFLGASRELPETDAVFPLTIGSDLLRESRKKHLAEDDVTASVIHRWMDHENAQISRRYSFRIDEARSFRTPTESVLLNEDVIRLCAAGDVVTLRLQKENAHTSEISVRIAYVYEDEITAVSESERPLCLYRIRMSEKKVIRNALARQEFRGFHVGMFLIERFEDNDDRIHIVIIDPKGKRYELNCEPLKRCFNGIIHVRTLFPDGVTRTLDLYPVPDTPFAIMPLDQGYIDLLKAL